jgi:hypothetical protein
MSELIALLCYCWRGNNRFIPVIDILEPRLATTRRCPSATPSVQRYTFLNFPKSPTTPAVTHIEVGRLWTSKNQ